MTGSASSGIAVVTGAGGGIGSAVARRLSADGYRVACVDVVAEAADATAGGLSDARAFRCDVSSAAEVDSLRTEIAKWDRGDVRLLVNVAGLFFEHSIVDLSEADWNRLIGVNLTGPFLTCRAFLPAMIAAGGGCVVNVASTAGLRGSRNRAAYSAAKAGLVMLTRSLALDHGKDGIRVNCLCPGLIDTDMAAWIREDPAALHRWEASTPAGRMGTPDEMAAAVSFLASPDASYVQGTVLSADGGVMA
ncbi:MAG: meso-butanediol dehydrogenase / (S,S)-butanediol dehydrogenase / diacetyl reductase [Pseudonocardiales bacterium]|nr:meso-butanediol dehydrogenase / (S,S)-butanediol dehydrogenase / diacetyl reductase [Pseudonocardiales bacterium]